MFNWLRTKLRGWLGVDKCETVKSADCLSERLNKLEAILGVPLGAAAIAKIGPPPKSRLDNLRDAIAEIKEIDGNQPVEYGPPETTWQTTKLGGAIRDLQTKVSALEHPPKPTAWGKKRRSRA